MIGRELRLRHSRKGPNLGTLLGAFVLFSTVVTAVGLGILAGYGAVLAILYSFGRQRGTAVGVLVPSQTHASGD
jgi:hypothetical protein